jgi:hypothetical protein
MDNTRRKRRSGAAIYQRNFPGTSLPLTVRSVEQHTAADCSHTEVALHADDFPLNDELETSCHH